MKISGERIIVFGDSLSKHGADSDPEAWNVDQGSNRISGQPGDLLASMLSEQGADAVRVNARVGRSAHNFWGRENTTGLLADDASFNPTKVVIILGTNDADSGVNPAIDATDMANIKNAYENMGAEVWAIGPFTYNNPALNAKVQPIVDMMDGLFGSKFIDGRPLSVQTGRAGDGVHFSPASAVPTAQAMSDALVSATSYGDYLPYVLGIGAAIIGWWGYKRYKARRTGLGMIDIVNGRRHTGSTNQLIRDGYKQVECKSGLIHQARCWTKR